MNIHIIPELNNIERSLELADKYQLKFEYNDFFSPDLLEDKKKLNNIIERYQSLGRDMREDTLHGAFFDITIHSKDKLIREASRYRVKQCMEIAARLGVRAVIFHTNYIANFSMKNYYEDWLEQNVEYWSELLREYKGLDIYMENMFDETPELLAKLGERMQSNPRFGICFDYGHAVCSSTSIREWTRTLSPYIKHMHVNDNDLKTDLHLSVGDGWIDWKEYQQLMKEFHICSSVLFEIKGYELQKRSLEHAVRNKLYPFFT